MASQSTAQKVQQQLPAQALEKEFIYNLQQQVYFLELQGKLLREKMSETKKQKSRGVEANPLFDAQLDENLPLTELFDKLRIHFAQQVKEAKTAQEQLKKDLDAKQLQIEEQKATIAELQQLKEQFTQRLDNEKAGLNGIIKQQQLDAEELRQQLEKQKLQTDLQAGQIADIQKINKQLNEQNYQSTAKIKELSDKINLLQSNKLASEHLQNELSKLQFDYKALQAKLEQLTTENIELQTANQQLKNDDFKIKSNYDVAQMEIKNLNNQLKMLQSEITNQTQSLSNARTQIDHLTQQLKQAQSKIEQLESYRFDMNKVIEAFNNKRKIEQLEEERTQISEQLAGQVNDNKVLNARIKELEIDAQGLNAQISRLTDKINADQQEVTEKQAAYHTLLLLNQDQAKQLGELTEERSATEELLKAAKARAEFLEAELAMKTELSSVQLEQFEALRRSNASLAETLAGLQAKFTNLGQSGARFVATAHKPIEPEKKVATAAYNCQVQGVE